MPYSLKTSKTGLESAESFRRRHKTIKMKGSSFEYSGIPLDVWGDGNVSVSNSEHHCLITGSTGFGKTRRLMYEGIVMSARAGNSLVILDPKGEQYRYTSEAVRACGHRVYVLNLRDPKNGCQYNPLTLIRDNWINGCKSHAITLLHDVARIVTEKLSGDRDAYWQLASIDAIIGFGLLLQEHDKPLTFESIHSQFNSWMKHRNLWDDLRSRFDTKAESWKHLSTIINLTADTTTSCVTSTFNSAIAPFVDNEDVRKMLSVSSFFLTDTGEEKTAIYLIIPDETTNLYVIASMFVDQLYSVLIRLADSSESGTLPVHVDFYLDEFGTIYGLDWSNKLAAARSRGILFFLAVQDLAQLTEKYGENAAHVILSNCRTWVYLGGRDTRIMQTLSWLSGKRDDGEPVLSINELNAIGTGSVIVLDGQKAYMGHLPDWEEWHIEGNAKLQMADTYQYSNPEIPSLLQLLDFKEPEAEKKQESGLESYEF